MFTCWAGELRKSSKNVAPKLSLNKKLFQFFGVTNSVVGQVRIQACNKTKAYYCHKIKRVLKSMLATSKLYKIYQAWPNMV